MHETLAMVGAGIPAFASTNMDNLVLLTILLGQPGQRRTAVLCGFITAIAAVVALGLAIARVADALPGAVMSYLGLIPLGMGVYRLRGVFRREPVGAGAPAVGALGVTGVAMVTLSNGADTLGVMLPIFAETPEPLTFVLAATVLATALAWFLFASWIAGHPWVRARVAKLERWLVPALLIAVGLYILVDTPTDTVVGDDALFLP